MKPMRIKILALDGEGNNDPDVDGGREYYLPTDMEAPDESAPQSTDFSKPIREGRPLSIPDKQNTDTEKLRLKQGVDFLTQIHRNVRETENGPPNTQTNWFHRVINANSFDPLLKDFAKRIEAQGHKEIGHGSDAYAFDFNGKVLRVCMDYRREWIEIFLQLIKKHPSKHFPVVYENGELESFYAIVMEKLDSITTEERILLDAFMSVVLTKSYGNLTPERAEQVRKLDAQQPGLASAYRNTIAYKKKAQGATLDINRGRNVMKRGSTYVIVDPYYKKSI